ncbi:response regulator [Larkinella soli]|uniref:response regulator n=1 Tax=Larkinella soli TaxID=1770527 RepID=UPI000FFBA610|nr:response regulator [Larkinella soli]
MVTGQDVYVVEDDAEDRFLLQLAFQRCNPNHRLSYFGHGEELLSHLEGLAEAQLPALIILDLNMPIMDGYETLEWLRRTQKYRVIPVLTYTTSENPDDVETIYRLGTNAFLTKPAQFSTLVTMVEHLDRYWLQQVKNGRN